ncbi:hypothetical protein RYX36_021258, partial [Vicia faba]
LLSIWIKSCQQNRTIYIGFIEKFILNRTIDIWFRDNQIRTNDFHHVKEITSCLAGNYFSEKDDFFGST